jgi:phage tail sheath gpL-like
LVADNAYSISIKLPNVVNFFGGGGHATADARESDAVYVTRTYTVYTDATPSAAELAELFRDRINADLYAAFDATAAAGVIELTACDATAGAFIIDVSNITGATTATPTANVLPVGLPLEVERYVDPSTVTAASYDRHIIKFRKFVNHNAVKGLEVVKEQALIVYSDTTDTLNATLEPILDGTHVPASDYLGAPEV